MPSHDRYLAEVLADSPLGVWPIHHHGSTLFDVSANQRHGAWTATDDAERQGPTAALPQCRRIIPGVPGESASVADAAWMDVATVTAEAWVFVRSITNSGEVMSRRIPSDSFSAQSWHLSVRTDGLIRMRWLTGSSARDCVGSTVLEFGRWYHIVGVATNGTSRVYVDGVLDGTASTAGSVNSSARSLCFGRTDNNLASERFDGHMAWAAMYGAELPAARVSAHYAASFSAPRVRAVAY